MKIEQKKPELSELDVVITLTAQEACRLADICGCNIIIPDRLSYGIPEGKEEIVSFLGNLFAPLLKLGYIRSRANWENKSI